MAMQLRLEMNKYEEEFFENKLSNINDSLQHMSKTIDDFREFFKPQKQKRVFNLRYLYKKIDNLMGDDYKSKGIELIPELSDVELNSFDNELVQVLINIINNAIDAINTKDTKRKLVLVKIYKNQDNAIIEVLDNGGGVPNEIINKIFEPYFTTKHKSQGTGIGLYMSGEIIKKHMDGNIVVENIEYGYDNQSYVGAKFIITLPLNT
jgi:signal transduction histidine kinase